VLQQQKNWADERDVLSAIVVGCFKENKKYQMTEAVVEAGSFAPAQPHITRAERDRAVSIVQVCLELNLEVLPITSARYPAQLREITAPPAALYLHSLNSGRCIPSKLVGVVGTRAASINTCRSASELSAALARAGLPVVSGLALGIDGAAHRGALESGAEFPTLAVLAHGLDRVYPPTHVGLAREILEAGGVIVSEYPPGTEPMKHHFLARNRIIAGLSQGIVVVQAGSRSGSLVTANFAAEYGRDVFVVQDSSNDELSKGGADLIDQGAMAIASAADVLLEYGFTQGGDRATECGLWKTMSVDSFIGITDLSAADMLRLELQGQIVRLPGNQVRVSSQIIE
jgi:DNA processing protein